MKKVFWLILAMCLLALPAMAECTHESGTCFGDCYVCGETGVTVLNPECVNLIYENDDDTHHLLTCMDCGAQTREQHSAMCDVSDGCMYCGAPGTDSMKVEHAGGRIKKDDTHHWQKCEFCGEEYNKEEHDFEWAEGYAATCTEEGMERAECSGCSMVAWRPIPALGHDDSEMEVTKEPTCEEDGEKTGTCPRCGTEVETVVIPALGHDDGEWVVIVEATCLEDGEQTGTCTRCEADLGTKPVEALGHDDGAWVVIKEATREEEGLKELHCTRCDGLLDSEVIPMVTVTHYPNNTACLDGSEFRDQENPVTDKWYTFLAIDLSEDGVQVFDLIASNMYRIGTVNLTVSEGTLTVDYELISSDITVHSEFLTLFNSLEEVTTVEQDAFTNYAYGEPINIQEALQGTAGYIYLCNGVSYNDQIPGLVRVSGR